MTDLRRTIEVGLRIIAKNVYDVEECAAFLGVSKDRVRHLVANRAIPYYKVGKAVRFNKNDLEKQMLDGVRIMTEEELKSKARRIRK